MNSVVKTRFSYLLLGWLILTQSCEKQKESGLPKDMDGNEYDTVVIGAQTWFKENLKTTKYKNGDPIYLITDDTKWSSWQTGAYCWYDNNPDYKATYGALYNLKTVSTDFLCPDGWHIPTATEWRELIAYLGGAHYAGGKLKETGTLHWISQSEDTTDETGFSALPGGCRYLDGSFRDIKLHGYWWMFNLNRYLTVHYSNEYSGEGSWDGNAGYSVRCIKDR
jgi:uncharacterized protein (TIGR02145 family)